MSVFAAPDARVLELNQRARLLRHAAGVIGAFNADLSEKVDEVAVAVAAEAMMIVAEDGAQPGESYHHHEDDNRPCVGDASPHRTLEQVDRGGALWPRRPATR